MTDANTKIELRPTKEVVNKTFAKLNKQLNDKIDKNHEKF